MPERIFVHVLGGRWRC